jgi:hypothetical protein
MSLPASCLSRHLCVLHIVLGASLRLAPSGPRFARSILFPTKLSNLGMLESKSSAFDCLFPTQSTSSIHGVVPLGDGPIFVKTQPKILYQLLSLKSEIALISIPGFHRLTFLSFCTSGDSLQAFAQITRHPAAA